MCRKIGAYRRYQLGGSGRVVLCLLGGNLLHRWVSWDSGPAWLSFAPSRMVCSSLVVRWDLTVGLCSNDHLTRLLVTFIADLYNNVYCLSSSLRQLTRGTLQFRVFLEQSLMGLRKFAPQFFHKNILPSKFSLQILLARCFLQ